jgi:uncharacterized membrane protein YedE/YeeE
MKRLCEFLAGLLFGVGLMISGMTDPSKVIGFLDISGAWDPSLAFVMGGAVLVGLVGFRIAKRRTATAFDQPMHWPGREDVDAKLIIGSLIFGAGWGLAGFCPGPALVNFAAGQSEAIWFVGAMLVGMGIHRWLERASHTPAE